MLLIEVDRVDPEPAEARLAGLADVLRATADPAGLTARVADIAELGGQHDLVAATADRSADELLVVTVAVDVGGVKQVDSEVQCAMDGRDPLRVGGVAVHARHRHAAETDRRHRGTDAAELPNLHQSSYLSPRTIERTPGLRLTTARGTSVESSRSQQLDRTAMSSKSCPLIKPACVC